jgi:hypothetical protein
MANGSIITNSGKKIIINRAYKSSPDYTVPSRFRIGISNGTPALADTDLDISVPIEDGTVCDDGSNTFTGSSGADNSTNNTTTFKQGAGQSDVTSQNLIADGAGTNVLKIWTIASLSANKTAAEPFGFWLYIKDATEYAKLKASGVALTVKFRTNGDGATLFYKYERTKAQLAAGWNWVTSGTTLTSALDQGAGGAPSGVLDEFVLEVETVNAGDEFAAGELLFDLLREWTVAERSKIYVTSYPTVDETNFETETRCFLTSVQANGFDINGFCLINTDGTILMHSEDVFTAESKSDTDQFTFIVKDRLI